MPRVRGPKLWRGLALLLCALFLASVARFYHPGQGFTALVVFPSGHADELPVLQALPHQDYGPGQGYDGAFYVQLAMEPLLKDPAIDRALDAPAYRARRILFSWTAWLAGFGRPAWILHAYSLQNVATWLVTAWLLTYWLPLVNGRMFLLWAAAMFSHGILASVRMSLLDGPSLLVLAAAMLASDRGRTWTAAAVVAISGLGRETNLLGSLALPWPGGWRAWLRAALAAALTLVPLLVWQDYIWSIYRGTSASAGVDHITTPLVAYVAKWQATIDAVRTHGVFSPPGWTAMVVASLTVQAIFVVVTARRWREPWWRLAAAYGALMFVVHYVVWNDYPGAVTRVILPLTFGFNILLAKWEGRSWWAWYVFGNLHVYAGLHVMPIPGLWLPF